MAQGNALGRNYPTRSFLISIAAVAAMEMRNGFVGPSVPRAGTMGYVITPLTGLK